jgi:hypothetical protein
MLFGKMNFKDFAKWYIELDKLRIFWAKPLKSITLNEGDLLLVKWLVRRKVKDAVLAVVREQYEVLGTIK